jgi:hypothetical protein
VPTGRVYLAQSLQWLHDLELTLLTVVQDAARSLEADNDGRWLAYRAGLCDSPGKPPEAMSQRL